MTSEEMDEKADEYDGEIMRMSGYDDCCVGVVERFGMNPTFCYDVARVIKKNMSMGMSEDDAWEYFYINQFSTWVSKGTPCFIFLGDTNETKDSI